MHHAVLSAVPPDAVAQAEALAGPDGQYDCFGGLGVASAYTLGVWVPGSQPFEAGADIGIPVAAGAKVLMQIHYHPGGHSNDPDTTQIAMRLTQQAPGAT